MCLAVPVKIVEIIDANRAKVEIDSVKLEVATTLVENINVGDYVVVHAGFIIEKLSDIDATEKLALLNEFYNQTGRA